MAEPQRLENGVKARSDGKGDAWSNLHRTGLGNATYMTDVDALVGLCGWSVNTAEKLFLEVVPDNYENRRSEVRKFAVVALFDRKRSLEYAQSAANQFTRQFYTWLCRTIGQTQPATPRFFYVIGSDQPPWDMYEVNTAKPEVCVHVGRIANASEIAHIWKYAGLLEKRNALVQWVTSPSRQDYQEATP